MILPFAYNPQPFADLSDFHSNLPALDLLSLTRSRPFQRSSRRRDSLFWHSDLSRHFDGHLRGSALTIPCSDVLVTDFAIVGVVERGISSITEYLGVFLLLNMYIFDLREQNNQTIRCTPHSKDYKSSVPSRRSRLRPILGLHCNPVFVSPLRSPVSIA